MGKQLETNANGNGVKLAGNTLSIVSGQQSIKQRIQRRLLTVRGAWRYDLDDGVPYFQRILGKTTSLDTVRSILSAVVAATPGVREVVELTLTGPDANRNLRVDVTCIASTGETVDLSVGVKIDVLGV